MKYLLIILLLMVAGVQVNAQTNRCDEWREISGLWLNWIYQKVDQYDLQMIRIERLKKNRNEYLYRLKFKRAREISRMIRREEKIADEILYWK